VDVSADPEQKQAWQQAIEAANRLLDALPGPAQRDDPAAGDVWAAMVVQEYEHLGGVLYRWAQICGIRPVPGQIAAPVEPGLHNAPWAVPLWDLLDAAAARDQDGMRAIALRVQELEWPDQIQLVYALGTVVQPLVAACGGRARLEKVAELVGRSVLPQLPVEVDIVLGPATLLIALVAAGQAESARLTQAEVFAHHPDRLGALSLVLAGVLAALGPIGAAITLDPDGTPASVRELREVDEDEAMDLSVLVRDLVDGMRAQDAVALAAVSVCMDGLGPDDKLKLGWLLASSAGVNTGNLLAAMESS
jgi:hypothetical protein